MDIHLWPISILRLYDFQPGGKLALRSCHSNRVPMGVNLPTRISGSMINGSTNLQYLGKSCNPKIMKLLLQGVVIMFPQVVRVSFEVIGNCVRERKDTLQKYLLGLYIFDRIRIKMCEKNEWIFFLSFFHGEVG